MVGLAGSEARKKVNGCRRLYTGCRGIMPHLTVFLKAKPMNKERELIERDYKYQNLKTLILNMMSSSGETGWYTDEDWFKRTGDGLSNNSYHQIVYDLLDDQEIKREFDRTATPPKTRWVMREGKK